MTDRILQDKVLSNSAYSHVINAPIDGSKQGRHDAA